VRAVGRMVWYRTWRPTIAAMLASLVILPPGARGQEVPEAQGSGPWILELAAGPSSNDMGLPDGQGSSWRLAVTGERRLVLSRWLGVSAGLKTSYRDVRADDGVVAWPDAQGWAADLQIVGAVQAGEMAGWPARPRLAVSGGRRWGGEVAYLDCMALWSSYYDPEQGCIPDPELGTSDVAGVVLEASVGVRVPLGRLELGLDGFVSRWTADLQFVEARTGTFVVDADYMGALLSLSWRF
jgi:hypothetical protein